MAAPDLDIIIDQGEDWTKIYQYFDEYGKWILMKAPGGFVMVDAEGIVNFQYTNLVYEVGVDLDGYPGSGGPTPGQQVKVALPRYVTLTMPPGKWRYGVSVSDALTADSIALVRGWATVRALGWEGC